MAEDWIKMRTHLFSDPKVSLMADLVFASDGELARYVRHNALRDMSVTRNVTRNAVVGALVTVWGVFRKQGRRINDDLVIQKCDLTAIDDVANLPGFGAAMCEVGWCQRHDVNVVMPRFFVEHNADPRSANARRQREYRQRKKDSNARYVTGNVTRNDREEREKRESKDIHTAAPERDVSTTEMAAVADSWNMLGGPFPKCAKVSTRRRAALKSRLADEWWRENWRAGMERVRGSPFLRGETGGTWVATFEWFLKPDSLTKIMEGTYDERARTATTGQPRESHEQARERANHEAIAGFLRSSGVCEGDAHADGAQAHGESHGAAIESVARRVRHVPAKNDQ